MKVKFIEGMTEDLLTRRPGDTLVAMIGSYPVAKFPFCRVLLQADETDG